MSESLDSYWPVVEPLFDQVSIDDPDSFLNSIKIVPRSSVHLFAAHFCLSEVWNGGLLQFFWNSTGLLGPEAIDGFHAIGMPTLAENIAAAAAPLGAEYPRNRDQRWDALLAGSKLSDSEIKQIFKSNKNLYLAYRRATLSFDFDHYTDQIYKLAETENRGLPTCRNPVREPKPLGVTSNKRMTTSANPVTSPRVTPSRHDLA